MQHRTVKSCSFDCRKFDILSLRSYSDAPAAEDIVHATEVHASERRGHC